MYCVYFLKSEKDGGVYVGKTNNVRRRFAEHCRGSVQSTKGRRPLVLLGYDECVDEAGSIAIEKEWKKGHKREELEKRFNL